MKIVKAILHYVIGNLFIMTLIGCLLVLFIGISLAKVSINDDYKEKFHESSLYTVFCMDEDGIITSWGSGFSTRSQNAVFTAEHVIKGCMEISVMPDLEDEFYPVYAAETYGLYDFAVLLPLLEYSDLTGTFRFSRDKEDFVAGKTVYILYVIDVIDGISMLYEGEIVDGSIWKKGHEATLFIEPGMSGAPVLNDQYEVIGIAVARIMETGETLFMEIPPGIK